MIITYHNLQFFKVQFGDTVLAFDPISKDSKFKGGRFGADIALISIKHQDFNGVEAVTVGNKEPFVISGPGEYEIKEVFIKGLSSRSGYEGKERINTIYTVNLESMNIVFLGGLGGVDLDPKTAEAVSDADIDILFVPIGGGGVLSSADAYKLAVNLEPKIIIPMHYEEAENKDALKVFLREGGSENVKPVDKLTLKRKDLEGKEGEIMVLKAQ
ncbi:MAG: MBL fold metallo-hydrolase [bacterium]|nr:MBL fold metallo-hydrolase [bacterium]